MACDLLILVVADDYFIGLE